MGLEPYTVLTGPHLPRIDPKHICLYRGIMQQPQRIIPNMHKPIKEIFL